MFRLWEPWPLKEALATADRLTCDHLKLGRRKYVQCVWINRLKVDTKRFN